MSFFASLRFEDSKQTSRWINIKLDQQTRRDPTVILKSDKVLYTVIFDNIRVTKQNTCGAGCPTPGHYGIINIIFECNVYINKDIQAH